MAVKLLLCLAFLLSCKPSIADRCLSHGGIPRLVNCRIEVVHEHDIADLDEYDTKIQHCDFQCVMPEQRFGNRATETP